MSLPDQRQERARAGLQAWSGFPADRQPRPLVLLSPAASAGGFPDGQKKMAFLRGAVEVAAPGFPGQILQALRGQPGDYAGPPLLVTTATLSSTEFCTDRGRRQLPAWKVRAQDVPEPIWVLDPATRRQAWQPPGPDLHGWRGTTAVLDADGRTLTMSFIGSPAGFTDYPDADVLESGGAVAIVPIPVDTGPPGLRIAIGQLREVTVSLARPLGERVLLDETGSPVMVTACVTVVA